MRQHEVHPNHQHIHGEACGHTRIQHEDHVGYLHDGHLHCPHEGHYDEEVIAVSSINPEGCSPVDCGCRHGESCGHEMVPHGDHVDYVHGGRLHYQHGDHCDDHGPVVLL